MASFIWVFFTVVSFRFGSGARPLVVTVGRCGAADRGAAPRRSRPVVMSTTYYAESDPRSRPPESWRGRLGALTSRGETDGPRVDEARRALSWWAAHGVFTEMIDRGQLTIETAEH